MLVLILAPTLCGFQTWCLYQYHYGVDLNPMVLNSYHIDVNINTNTELYIRHR